MMIKNKTGAWGETYAARYLRDHGYSILTVNYTCRFGELDLIAERDGVISFVEVKTRDQATALRPMEAVDLQKQSRMALTAQQFLRRYKLEARTRFDVCEVYLADGRDLVRINYMENAF